MTYEEALDWLIHKISIDVQNSRDIPKDIECLETCEKALNKQIPKPVANKDLIGTFRDNRIYYGECPACGKAITSVSCKTWCDQCGQSLEWRV